MIGSNKPAVALMLAAAFFIGGGLLLVSRYIASQNNARYAVLAEQIDQVTAKLTGFEDAFKSLDAEIRQVHLAVRDNAQSGGFGQTMPVFEPVDAVDTVAAPPGKDDDSALFDNLAPPDTPTDQEMVSVTSIVDKLRARDVYAYPDFPSLMASPEMVKLTPAAKNMVMAEMARMLKSGQLDPSFFPR